MTRLLAINPGSTSTKLGLFDGEQLIWDLTVRHSDEQLAPFRRVSDQYDFRLKVIEEALRQKGCDLTGLDAIVGRGGIFDPIEGGTYRVDEELVDRLAEGVPWDHASNLGGRLAYGLAQPLGKPAFIVDPVSVDELDDVARYTGLAQIKRVSLVHALNCKAMARRAAQELGKAFEDCRFVVAHLGGGVTICAVREGRIVDFDSGNDGGPLAPERAGRLPASSLVEMAFEPGADLKTLKSTLAGRSGLKALCGSADVKEILSRAQDGDATCDMALKAFIYNVACTMGMMATALDGEVDAFLLTGGIAYSPHVVAGLRSKIDWAAPVLVYPGEDELLALAQGARRGVEGLEEVKIYHRRVH